MSAPKRKPRPKAPAAPPPLERTPRGFAVFGRVTDNRGNVATVQESSAAEGSYCWVFVKDDEGHAVVPCAAAPGGYSAVSSHLNPAQARALAALLVRFADYAEGT